MTKVMAAVLACALWAGLAAADAPEQGIIVNGEGLVTAPADMATITLGVTETAKTRDEVIASVTQTAAAIQDELKALGIDEADRQTSGFYLRPIQSNAASFDGDTPRITGYRAGNTIQVRIRNLTLSEEVMAKVVDVGVNHFNGLSFTLQDRKAAEAAARAFAVADATLKAEQLAEAAGVALGGVLRITEAGQQTSPMMLESAERQMSTRDAMIAGDIEVRAQVTMVFAIAPGLQ